MIARRTLLMLIALPLAAACFAQQRSAAAVPIAAVVQDTVVYLLDGERITEADVRLIDSTAIWQVSTFSGDQARLRFGIDARSVVEFISKSERRGSGPSSAAPLFLVDGRVVPTALFNVFDPRHIRKLDVMKGAQAEEKYGERARSGVVLITTKSGES